MFLDSESWGRQKNCQRICEKSTMEVPSSSNKNVLLQVWCGLLTVAMVVMAALLVTIKAKSNEDGLSLPTLTRADHFRPTGLSSSYIQLMKSSSSHPWVTGPPSCDPCTLTLRDDSIQSAKDGVYFLYVHVTFTKGLRSSKDKSVVLTRNATSGKSTRKLVEGTFPATTHGSVWVANMVRLQEGDSVSVNISGDFLTEETFWGAFELH
ncbi:lymphotoxin-alpha isoform X3 [Entelurus aequoreus]|nr:lymphotoxin-alpha isoform X3 [Entelurus aequoreus]XP_061920147.1 lymphotoxin-alpha isoform X3 [Entelurus aequoreus]XP_061920148.1 lymphotoxin-alpha isoform X3 [Entelurus aequoreus]XP_061920149.1 lymphotoxin-alpha isoform X3 [Entelurus aequoreus]